MRFVEDKPIESTPAPYSPIDLLARIRIVLVETSHPGNIGAVARAMKSMGLSKLCLVRPKRFPCAEATARAAGADDVLMSALVCDALLDAIEPCTLVAATTARARRIAVPVISPRALAAHAIDRAMNAPAPQKSVGCVGSGGRAGFEAAAVGIVFGRESAGLSNEEIDLCQALVRVPTEACFNSLNVAAALQIVAYELRSAAIAAIAASGQDIEPPAAATTPGSQPQPQPQPQPATAGEIDGLYRHLHETLVEIDFLDPKEQKPLMRRLMRLFNRAGLERSEIHILRGILSATQKTSRR